MKKLLDIGFIGAGNMAQALMAGIIRRGISGSRIGAYDPDSKKLKALAARFKIRPLKNNGDVVKNSQIVVLATKPQEIKTVLREISSGLRDQLLISIAAGVDTATRTKNPNPNSKIVRAMPNNPALIGQGITALYSRLKLSQAQRKAVEGVFLGSGEVFWVKKEGDLDAVTGLSGSGPAYVYRFVEALTQAGVKVGLSRNLSHRLALKTVLGSALTLQKTQKLPSELIPLVTSKKGTTLAGLKVLDQKGFHHILAHTVRAATRRAREIRKEIRQGGS